METVSALTGQPIVATLAGKQHKFKQLTLAELFGRFESEVKNEWVVRAHEMGNKLALPERIEFLSYQASHPLAAEQSSILIRDKMNSASGVELILSLTHLVEDKNDVLPEIMSLVVDPVDKVVIKGLIESLTGTAGMKAEGSDSPKA